MRALMQADARRRRTYGKPTDFVTPVFNSQDLYIGDYVRDMFVRAVCTERPLKLRHAEYWSVKDAYQRKAMQDSWEEKLDKAIKHIPLPAAAAVNSNKTKSGPRVHVLIMILRMTMSV